LLGKSTIVNNTGKAYNNVNLSLMDGEINFSNLNEVDLLAKGKLKYDIYTLYNM